MSQSQGCNAFFGFVDQVAFATPVTPPTKWIWAETITPGDERKIIHKPLLGRVSRSHKINDKHAPTCTVKFPFLWEGCEKLLRAALGSVSTGSGPPYTHTFSLAAALPMLTCYADIDEGAIAGDHVQQLVGAQVDKFTMTQEMGGTLDVEMELSGREWIDVARTAPTMPTFDPADYSQMTLATINPASDNYELLIRKWKLEISNNLYKDKYELTGAGKRSGHGRAGQRSVSMEFELSYEDDTPAGHYKNLTSKDLRFKWVSSARELTITTPAGYFAGSRPGASDAGPVYTTAPYDALATSSDNNELSLLLTNTVSAV